MLERDLAADNKEGVRSDIARIGSAANKMLGLLSDLLELSRVGRTNNAMENVALAEVMRDALELLSGAIAARGVEVEITDDLPEVYGDRVRLVQVAQNLIENAIKYMGDQPSPRVEIGTRHDPKYEVCFVKDNGVGVDCRYVERIFGLFEKLNPRSEGSGVGLALVRRILESHGGSIWVESGNEGGGSTFVFRLPRRTPTIQSSLRPGGLA
jgi:signal transduction histidine kinase